MHRIASKLQYLNMMLLLTFAFSYVPWKKWYPLKSLISLDSVHHIWVTLQLLLAYLQKNVAGQLKGKIAGGIYCIGSLIIPQRFE